MSDTSKRLQSWEPGPLHRLLKCTLCSYTSCGWAPGAVISRASGNCFDAGVLPSGGSLVAPVSVPHCYLCSLAPADAPQGSALPLPAKDQGAPAPPGANELYEEPPTRAAKTIQRSREVGRHLPRNREQHPYRCQAVLHRFIFNLLLRVAETLFIFPAWQLVGLSVVRSWLDVMEMTKRLASFSRISLCWVI